MKLCTLKLRSLLGVIAIAGAAVVLPAPASSFPVAQAAGELGAGGEFHSLTPARIFDSRPESAVNDVAPAGIKPSGPGLPSFDIVALGQGGVPNSAADVLGVVISVAVANQSSAGNIRAYPSGGAASGSAVLAYGTGPAVSNLAIVRPGANGKITLALESAGAAASHVTVDVFGWISASSYATRGGRLITRTPSRLLDSRDGTGGQNGPIAGGTTIRLPIRGADGVAPAVTDAVPNDPNVVAVMLNIAAVNNLGGSAGTYISALPENPSGTPNTANVNVAAGRTKSNTVLVPVGADGAIRLYNRNGSSHLIADVVGYVVNNANVDTRAGRVVPLSSPYRSLDTRAALHGAVRLPAKQAEKWSFTAFAGSVTIDGVAAGNQVGLIGNFTTVALTGATAGYVTLYPDAASRPTAATVNNTTSAVSNLAVGAYAGDGTMMVYNENGSIHYVLDVLAVVLTD